MTINALLQVINQSTLPLKSDVFALSEFLELCQIEEIRLQELISIEFIQPSELYNSELIFTKNDAHKVMKLQRICKDFELSDLGGSIIIDLLEKIRILEEQIQNN